MWLWPKAELVYDILHPTLLVKILRALLEVLSKVCHEIYFNVACFWSKSNASLHLTKMEGSTNT
jgi:hypothetical protein